MVSWFFIPALNPEAERSAVTILAAALLAAGALGQVYRYARISHPTERQQTKWVVFSLAIMVVFGSVIVGLEEILPPALGAGLSAMGMNLVVGLSIC